jgi:hypothetical protein
MNCSILLIFERTSSFSFGWKKPRSASERKRCLNLGDVRKTPNPQLFIAGAGKQAHFQGSKARDLIDHQVQRFSLLWDSFLWSWPMAVRCHCNRHTVNISR